MSTIPQGLQDALTNALTLKDTADQAVANKSATAANLAKAIADDQAAQAALDQAGTNLDTARQQVDALMDAYLKPGATLPQPAPAPAPDPAPAPVDPAPAPTTNDAPVSVKK